MPSKLPRVSFVISGEELELVKQYQKENNIKSISKAVLSMIEQGLANENHRMAEEAARKAEQPAETGELSNEAVEVVNLLRSVPDRDLPLATALVKSVLLTVLQYSPVPEEKLSHVPAVSSR